MNAIRSSQKALERIRQSGSFPSTPQPDQRRGGPAEVTLGDSDDDSTLQGGKRAVGSLADDKVRELNKIGLDALQKRDLNRGKQMLEDALAAVKRGDISDNGLTASTYANYGAMLLATSKNPDKAVEVLADAVVRITRLPPDMKSRDLELCLQNMQSVLASALERDSGGLDIRLEVISQYVAGVRLERERKGFECLEHLRIAHDLSRTCMGIGHPTHKAIGGVFERAKKAYAAGATTFQSKKAGNVSTNIHGKQGTVAIGKDNDDSDFLGEAKDGLGGLFEKGLSNDVWSALKDAGRGKAKGGGGVTLKGGGGGKRVETGTATNASLADRILHSREGNRGASRGGNREETPPPDILSGAGKKSRCSVYLLY
jgi:hypothetical protein